MSSLCSFFLGALGGNEVKPASADLPGPVFKDGPPAGLLLDVKVITVGMIKQGWMADQSRG